MRESDFDEPFPPRECASGAIRGTATAFSAPSADDRQGWGANKSNGGAILQRNVLALDLGSKCGWAVATRSGLIQLGTESFSARKSWTYGDIGNAYRAWLNRICEHHQIHAIAFEEVMNHTAAHAAHMYGAFQMLTYMTASSRAISMHPVGVGVVKKTWTGWGDASKQGMIDEAKRRGYRPDSDNAADALAILNWALSNETGGALVVGDGSMPDPKKVDRRSRKVAQKAAIQPQQELV